MRGHLWLGFLALPMILFHGGFHFGGTLTRVLMWLLIITVFSGVFGAALQHYIPRVMTSDVPLETIYDEIGRVRALLMDAGVLSEQAAADLEQEVAQEVAEATTWAEAQPDAPPEAALLHTWAEQPVASLAWMRPA